MSSLRRIASRSSHSRRPFSLAGCGGGGGGEGTTAGDDRSRRPRSPSARRSTRRRPTRSTLKTNEGTFSFDLDVKDSPNTTASFASLVRKGFFDGLTFHRIVPDFVIQGGDPKGDGTGGPGYTTVDTPPSDAKYTKGVVAMAKTGAEPPGTSGSQFFVVTGADVGLPPDYAVLGKVIERHGRVEKIGKLGDPATRAADEEGRDREGDDRRELGAAGAFAR